jgi:hypothetical protein
METATPSAPLAFRETLRPFLSDREELVWTGRPQQGIAFRKSDLFLVPFTFLFTLLIVLTFPVRLIAENSHLPLPLIVAFSLYGVVLLYVLVGRFLVDAYLRSKITYGITNRHVMIHSKGGTTRSFEIRGLTHLSVEAGKDGRGTVTIGSKKRPTQLVLRGLPLPNQDAYLPPALELIPDAQHVYRLLQELRD